jgi:uncharacterized membrane protein HdeD (DUF308 family)
MHTLITFLLTPSILGVLILIGGILTYTGYRDWQADRNNWKGNS